jgi:predicted aspartyl protease
VLPLIPHARRLGLLLAGLAALQACSAATSHQDARPAPPGTTVRIRQINGKLLVPVVLNDGQTATLLLDTGASMTVITADLARRAGAEPDPARARARIASGQEVDVSLVRLRSIRVGTAQVGGLRVAVYELAALNRSPSLPVAIDGFLGMDFIGRFTMTLDPRAATLTLQPALR